MSLLLRLFLLAAVLIGGQSRLLAEAPGLESLYPAGGRAGERIEVKVTGKGLDKNNPQSWCSNRGVTLQPVPLTGDKAKDKALAGLWHITIAKDAAPGPCLVRFYNNDGSSPPRIFEVGTHPEYSEQEPNDSVKQSSSSSNSNSNSNSNATPQAPASPTPQLQNSTTPPSPLAPPPSLPTAPATLNGLLAKDGDADLHPIRVSKGVPLTLELHGYSLGSPMDPAMRLLDERGVELAASHDTHNLDPLIRYTPKADTTLYLQVHAFVHPPQADIAFKGSVNHIYRLHITSQPSASAAASSSSYSNSSSTPAAPTPSTAPESSSSHKEPPPLPAVSSGLPKTPSLHPSTTPSKSPFTAQGTLITPGQEASHTFTAKKGDDLQITVRAKAIRSSLEAVFRLESLTPDGQLLKVLQTVDDSASIREAGSFTVLDPALHWKAPADGNYRIVVADRFQNGSPHHRYEVEVKPWQPTVTATLAEHAFVLQPGKSTDIKLTLAYDGAFPHKLLARAKDLPPGVTAADAELPAKNGEAKLTLKAAAEAPAAQAPFTLEIIPATPLPATSTTAPASAPASSSSSGSNSSPAPSAPGSTLASPPLQDSTTPSLPAPVPLTLATYPIPFKDLRGDLLIPTDTRPWLTVPKAAAAPSKDKGSDLEKNAKAKAPKP